MAASCAATLLVSHADAAVWGGFDATRVNYAGGVISGTAHTTLQGLITANGDTVGALTGTLDNAYLSTIDIFYTSLLTNNDVPLSAAEQTAVQTWIANGGVLIVTGDIFNEVGYDSFVTFAGVTGFLDTNSGTPATTVGAHPLVNGINMIGGTTHVTFTYNLATATPLANAGNNPFAVVLDGSSGWAGGGCILVVGDHNIFTQSFINQNNNQAFLSNIVSWTSTCVAQLPNGSPCVGDGQCMSGFCVDSVCCDTACGGNATDDCQACSVAAGAMADGTCGLLDMTTECRAAADVCDAPETCTGMDPLCPADAAAPAGTECRPSTDLCDAAEVCDGVAITCPADAVAVDGTECRAAAGPCDVAETCNGVVATCPADSIAPMGMECRAAVDMCDMAEVCTGTGTDCPADETVPDGTSCDDGDMCTTGDICEAGVCAGEDTCGAGGSGGSSSASTGGGDSDDDDGDVDSEGGCGCRTAGEPSSGYAWLLLAAGGWLAARRRRRNRRA